MIVKGLYVESTFGKVTVYVPKQPKLRARLRTAGFNIDGSREDGLGILQHRYPHLSRQEGLILLQAHHPATGVGKTRSERRESRAEQAVAMGRAASHSNGEITRHESHETSVSPKLRPSFPPGTPRKTIETAEKVYDQLGIVIVHH